ncbi:MAG: hypothetical protein MK135_01355 [Polyangiaceae bacterium]|nr:hypothetical protein [Polyangiaceae bacterium]
MKLRFGTPRKLPKASQLEGRVVVLDIAFAASTGGGFEKVTGKFIRQLENRLVGWVDHHDHELHERFASDPRFFLSTKAEHGACPEMITPEVVAQVGEVDTIVCHTDFDGLASAAKWLNGGAEPFEGCDADAHAIDTRLGEPSKNAQRIDRALRARPRDQELLRSVVRLMLGGCQDRALWSQVDQAAGELVPIEKETRRAAQKYKCYSRRFGGGLAYVDISEGFGRLDKTELLLLGQKLEMISMVVDQQTVTLAAPFDSGLNFLTLLGIEGGMPTRVSVQRKRLDEVLDRLEVDFV